MSDDVRETNRAHWDALAAVHGQDAYYDAEALVAGRDSLSEPRVRGGRGCRRARRAAPAVPHRLRLDLAGAPRRARDRRGLLARRRWRRRRELAARRGRERGVRRGGRDGAPGRAARPLRPRLLDDRRDLLDRRHRRVDALRPRGAAAGRAARAGRDPPALHHGRVARPARARLPLRVRRAARASTSPGSYADRGRGRRVPTETSSTRTRSARS